MKRFLLGAASGVLVALVGVGLWAVVADHLEPRLVQEVCDPAAVVAPLCVQLRDDGTPGGVLWVAPKDPDLGPRITYAASPFTDLEFGTSERIEVTFEPDRVVVHGNEGSQLVLTEDFYAND